jgi:predicted flap endonuclease-1-like 5' DNA nuclease
MTLTIEEIPGVGAAKAEKLREGGYETVEAICHTDPAEMKELTGLSRAVSEKTIEAAKASLGFKEPAVHPIDSLVPEAAQEEVIEMTVDDLPGVGPATADKLREAGYEDLMAIATSSPSELSEKCDVGEGVAQKIINAARKLADVGGFETGLFIEDRRTTVNKIHSGSKAFDELMGGGIETQCITEFYGEFGSCKTHYSSILRTRSAPNEFAKWPKQTAWIPKKFSQKSTWPAPSTVTIK